MNNNMDGFQRRRERKKEIIRQVALELFSNYGIQKVTIADIAKKANVSQVTIYNYFGSKDELLKDVLIQFAHRKYEEYNEIIESNIPYPDKIEQIVFNKKQLGRTLNKEFIDAFFLNDPGLKKFIEDLFHKETIPIMKKIIEQGKKEGYISQDISPEAVWFYIDLFKASLNRPEMYLRLDQKALTDVVDLFLYGLLEKKGT